MPFERIDQTYTPQRRPAPISRRFAADRRAAQAARRALETLRSELEPAEFHIAALLTTELVANAVEHGNTGRRDSVRLQVTLTDCHVRIAVGDQGAAFVPTPRGPDAPLDSHWGLHLVGELADRWGVAQEPETTVWFELQRSVASQTMAAVTTGHQAPAA